MLDGLPDRACWRREDAETMLRIEALGGDDTLFLATHTPIRGFGLAGSRRQDLAEPTETALLEALSDPARTHALCVVQGDPGSGKSHLIRWMSIKWRQPDDVVLLLQRADGSLQGALEQLQTRLTSKWPEFAPLFEGLDKRQKARISGRAAMFHSALGVMMMPDSLEQPPEDADWCDRHDLSLLIQSRHVRAGWKAPRRILELIDGKGQARNSESARFNLSDMLDLASVCGPVDDSVVSQRFGRQLRAEAAMVADWQGLGETLSEISTAHARELPASLGLIRALNLRLNDAVQNVLGVSGESLVLLFRKLREGLKGRARLVLLLEDITAWQGLDNSLIDALVLDADTRADICPLISVVGVTPDYYDALQKNYLDRITHEVRLGQVGDGAVEAVTLRDADDRHTFAARYLNATRAGKTQLEDWREILARDPDSVPPNPCLDCRHREPCHAAFGEVESMGLYPFTAPAIERLFHALKTDDKGQTHRTPRGLLQNVLGPTLRHPEMLAADQYPGPDLETEKFDERARLLTGPMRTLVEGQSEDATVRERLRRTIVYWGDPSRPETTMGDDGFERFADVSAQIFQTFGLPWPGGSVTEPAPNPLQPPSNDASNLPQDAPSTATAAAGAVAVATTTPQTSGPATRTTPARAALTSKPKLQRLQAYVAEARDGGEFREGGLWNEVLFELLKLLDARALGFAPWTWTSVFTESLVQVAGTGQARGYSFAVPREAWLYDGLEAYCALKSGGAGAAEAYHRRRLAFALRRLGKLAQAHGRRRIPALPDDKSWDMAASATQVLLARAWLKGAAAPDDPTHEQWRVVLSDEDGAASDPVSRTEPWRDALRNTDQQHDKLRMMLRELVSLPQGASNDFGLANAGGVALAIVRLRDRFSFLPISEAPASTALIDDRSLRQTAGKLRDYLARIPPGEFKLLQDRAAQLGGLLRGEGLRARAGRLDAAVSEAFKHIRELPGEHERKWREDWRRISADLAKPEVVDGVQGLLVAFETPEDIPDHPAARLQWLVAQPAGALRAFLDFMKESDQLVAVLLERAQAYAKAAETGGDLNSLNAAGADLKTGVTEARAAWAGGAA